MKTEAGNAWIELRVGLDRPLDLPPPHLHLGGVQHGNHRHARRAADLVKTGPKVSEKDSAKDNNVEEELFKNKNINTENVTHTSF